jgi:hypothetical protein
MQKRTSSDDALLDEFTTYQAVGSVVDYQTNVTSLLKVRVVGFGSAISENVRIQ